MTNARGPPRRDPGPTSPEWYSMSRSRQPGGRASDLAPAPASGAVGAKRGPRRHRDIHRRISWVNPSLVRRAEEPAARQVGSSLHSTSPDVDAFQYHLDLIVVIAYKEE